MLDQEGNDSELSDVSSDESSDEFEDVDINGVRDRVTAKSKRKVDTIDGEVEKEEAGGGGSDDEEEEWEDALGSYHHGHNPSGGNIPTLIPSGDLELTLSSSAHATASSSNGAGGKKGPSKIQRHIRMMTHCMHVQFLMFHNLIRNAWIQDKELQQILIRGLSKGCWKAVETWWRDAGISDGSRNVVEGGYPGNTSRPSLRTLKGKSKGKERASGMISSAKELKPQNDKPSARDKGQTSSNRDRSQRDWGASSSRLEPNMPNLSAGDPLIRLLKYLTTFWKQKYNITAPCLRKRGYLPPCALEAEIEAWRRNPSQPDLFGERVENLEAFRDLARKCTGSRDVGQQLFTALLRGLGIEARMVASLQPGGFGWTKAEERNPQKGLEMIAVEGGNVDEQESANNEGGANRAPPMTAQKTTTPNRTKRKRLQGSRDSPIHNDIDKTSNISSLSYDSDSSLGIPNSASKKTTISRKYSQEVPYPTYWTEALSPTTQTPIAVSALAFTHIAPASNASLLEQIYPRGSAYDKAKQVFCYVIAFSSDGTAKDVTTRYLPKRIWPGRTKGFRIPVEKVPIYDKQGKVRKWEEWDWFKDVLRAYARGIEKRTVWDEVEDEGDLVPAEPPKPKAMHEEGGKETLQAYKSSSEFVLERHLRREEALVPGAKVVRHFTTGKGDKQTTEPVYRRKDVATCRTVESWHKEGREVKEGEQPLKFVPMRAVTTIRKREIEEREREEGVKIKQGLYSEAQTNWIIPEPIQNGRIPRNAFGNIDVYVPTMVPKGAVHIPLKGTARVCKKLGVDFAEACTGFEFGKRRAVPVLTGVVVAEENEDLVIDAWEADEAEKRIKEESKREKLVLSLWKKFALGLRIVERMKKEYGEELDHLSKDVNPFTKTKPIAGHSENGLHDSKALPEDHDGLEGGFVRDEDEDDTAHGGGFVFESEDASVVYLHKDATQYRPQTPISLQLAHQVQEKETAEDNDIDKSESNAVAVPSTQRERVPRRHGRGRGRARMSRGGRVSVTSMTPQTKSAPKQKRLEEEDDDQRSPLGLSDLASDASSAFDTDDDRDFGSSTKASSSSGILAGTRPKRNAARKSQAAVRSHYFQP